MYDKGLDKYDNFILESRTSASLYSPEKFREILDSFQNILMKRKFLSSLLSMQRRLNCKNV